MKKNVQNKKGGISGSGSVRIIYFKTVHYEANSIVGVQF